jgi:hypothetical protein
MAWCYTELDYYAWQYICIATDGGVAGAMLYQGIPFDIM